METRPQLRCQKGESTVGCGINNCAMIVSSPKALLGDFVKGKNPSTATWQSVIDPATIVKNSEATGRRQIEVCLSKSGQQIPGIVARIGYQNSSVEFVCTCVAAHDAPLSYHEYDSSPTGITSEAELPRHNEESVTCRTVSQNKIAIYDHRHRIRGRHLRRQPGGIDATWKKNRIGTLRDQLHQAIQRRRSLHVRGQSWEYQDARFFRPRRRAVNAIITTLVGRGNASATISAVYYVRYFGGV